LLRQSASSNESVNTAYLYPNLVDGEDDEVWEKVGQQAIGILQALKVLYICTYDQLMTMMMRNYPLLTRILHARLEDEPTLANPESLRELLRVPSLRSVCFYYFCFTRALCQAAAHALVKDTVIINLSFSAKECDVIMAKALVASNTSVQWHASTSCRSVMERFVTPWLRLFRRFDSTESFLSVRHCRYRSLAAAPFGFRKE
jgi:hypothetical protein